MSFLQRERQKLDRAPSLPHRKSGPAGMSFLQRERQKLDYSSAFFEVDSHPPVLFDPEKVVVDDYFRWHNIEHLSQLEHWKQNLLMHKKDRRNRQRKAKKTLEAATEFLRLRGLVDDEVLFVRFC